MELLHALMGSLFTILITGSVSFIAYKVVAIAGEISEIKDTLKEMQRGGGMAGKNTAPPLASYPPPAESRQAESEFVLPPPISRRLDAERGIQRDPSDEFSMGAKSSEWRR